MNVLRSKLFIFFTITLLSITLEAQNEHSIVGRWQLQKISFKKTNADNSNDKELFLNIFKAALYLELTEEQRINFDDLECMNAQAETLRDNHYQSTIDFKANGAFYNTSQYLDKVLSGEYLLDKKKLLLEWETSDKNELKIVKLTADALVLKDGKLKVNYYYNRLPQKEIDKLSARFKKEKELECTKPDKVRIEAEKTEKEKLKSKTSIHN